MVAVLHDNLWFCQDCTIFACNGDTSGMSDETEKRVTEGAESLATAWNGSAVPNFDGETGEGFLEFAHMGCDCCGSRLSGDRHRFSILGTPKPKSKSSPEWFKALVKALDHSSLIPCYEIKHKGTRVNMCVPTAFVANAAELIVAGIPREDLPQGFTFSVKVSSQ